MAVASEESDLIGGLLVILAWRSRCWCSDRVGRHRLGMALMALGRMTGKGKQARCASRPWSQKLAQTWLRVEGAPMTARQLAAKQCWVRGGLVALVVGDHGDHRRSDPPSPAQMF